MNIKSQNNYSVEAGAGIHINRTFKYNENNILNFNMSLAAYHEFSDPYSTELGMNGMKDSFTIKDENRQDNRGVLRVGINYSHENMILEGNLSSYIDGTINNNIGLNFKYNF